MLRGRTAAPIWIRTVAEVLAAAADGQMSSSEEQGATATGSNCKNQNAISHQVKRQSSSGQFLDVILKEKRRQFTLQQKLDYLKILEEKYMNNKKKFEVEMGIDRKTVRVWQNQKSAMLTLSTQRPRLVQMRVHCGKSSKKSKFPLVDKMVYDWVVEQRNLGVKVNGIAIRNKAVEVFKLQQAVEPTQEAFVASHGWLDNFLRRTSLSARNQTNQTSLVAKDAKVQKEDD